MAFASAVTGVNYFGNKKIVWGTYTNGSGDTGGDIATGLSTVDYLDLQSKGSSVIATAPVVNETFPLSNSTGAVTVVTADNEDGYWFAFGN